MSAHTPSIAQSLLKSAQVVKHLEKHGLTVMSVQVETDRPLIEIEPHDDMLKVVGYMRTTNSSHFRHLVGQINGVLVKADLDYRAERVLH